jgi:GNAT superfamily N-acetyltransferase
MMTVSIRKACLADCRRIGEISARSWQYAYKDILPAAYLAAIQPEDRAERFKNVLLSGSLLFVAESEGTIAGFISGGKCRDKLHPEYDGEVYAIYVDPASVKQGVGTKLIRVLEEQLAAEGLTGIVAWMLAGNEAKHFYEGLGGQKIGEDQFKIEGTAYPEIAYGWKIADS